MDALIIFLSGLASCTDLLHPSQTHCYRGDCFAAQLIWQMSQWQLSVLHRICCALYLWIYFHSNLSDQRHLTYVHARSCYPKGMPRPWKEMPCPCVLLTRRSLLWGCLDGLMFAHQNSPIFAYLMVKKCYAPTKESIDVWLPQFKATPPTPKFSIVRAGISTLAK